MSNFLGFGAMSHSAAMNRRQNVVQHSAAMDEYIDQTLHTTTRCPFQSLHFVSSAAARESTTRHRKTVIFYFFGDHQTGTFKHGVFGEAHNVALRSIVGMN